MEITIFYIFEPTPALCQLARSAGEEYLAQPSVWSVLQNDRVGAKYKREELEHAQWMHFVANLIVDDETNESLEFRTKCLEMGFHGCWFTVQTKVGGPAEELMEEGGRAHKFLAAHGIAS